MTASVEGGGRVRAEELVGSELEREGLGRLRELSGDRDGPMERHGIRCFLLGRRLAELRGIEIDRELFLLAALVHDIGLYPGASRGGPYVTDGREWAAGLLDGREGWDPRRIERCQKAIERHHELRPQWDAGAEVELLRRADLIEVSGGLVRFGLEREWLRGLWAAVPRDGFYAEIGRLVLCAARERPTTIPRIFLRGKG